VIPLWINPDLIADRQYAGKFFVCAHSDPDAEQSVRTHFDREHAAQLAISHERPGMRASGLCDSFRSNPGEPDVRCIVTELAEGSFFVVQHVMRPIVCKKKVAISCDTSTSAARFARLSLFDDATHFPLP
jgi:hypothetical protein